VARFAHLLGDLVLLTNARFMNQISIFKTLELVQTSMDVPDRIGLAQVLFSRNWNKEASLKARSKRFEV
jgi:hypothetical protein